LRNGVVIFINVKCDYLYAIFRRKLVDDKRKTQEVSESIPSFSFPLRDRNIQEGNGVKLIACVDGLPQPKVIILKVFVLIERRKSDKNTEVLT